MGAWQCGCRGRGKREQINRNLQITRILPGSKSEYEIGFTLKFFLLIPTYESWSACVSPRFFQLFVGKAGYLCTCPEVAPG